METQRRGSYSFAHDYEEPYDRRSKMQSFVAEATQEAMARKGKTVLHNPDLYKAPAQQQDNISRTDTATVHSDQDTELTRHSSFQFYQIPNPVPNPLPIIPVPPFHPPLVPWEARAPADPQRNVISSLNIPSGLSMSELEVIANAINNPAPGLEFPEIRSPTRSCNDYINGGPIDKNLDPIDQVGSSEWAQLRHITRAERERVRICMATAAADITTNVPQPSILGKCEDVSINKLGLAHSQKWFQYDGRGEETLRAQIPAIADRHAFVRRANAANANSGTLPKDFKVGVDDGMVANLALGDVVANLTTYLAGDRKSVEQRRNFHKVKSVPEFATERGGLLNGSSNVAESYFDGDQGGFYAAPVRIARDPRFRPQGKEGLKLKPEEEWRNRHEMYGRRLM